MVDPWDTMGGGGGERERGREGGREGWGGGGGGGEREREGGREGWGGGGGGGGGEGGREDIRKEDIRKCFFQSCFLYLHVAMHVSEVGGTCDWTLRCTRYYIHLVEMTETFMFIRILCSHWLFHVTTISRSSWYIYQHLAGEFYITMKIPLCKNHSYMCDSWGKNWWSNCVGMAATGEELLCEWEPRNMKGRYTVAVRHLLTAVLLHL